MTTKMKNIDQTLIRDLANILNETNLTEIEVEQDDFCIRVSRNMLTTQVLTAPTPELSSPHLTATASAPDISPAHTSDESKSSGSNIASPMVGTAYLAPSPESDNFIRIGQNIKEGETLLIIEAMKTMNQIPSTKSGKIIDICVEDGQPVEFGDSLVIIE